MPFCDGFRLLGKIGRRTDVARQIGEIALNLLRGRNGGTMLETALGILDAALSYRTGKYALQGRGLGLFGGLEIVHPVQCGTDDFGHRAPEIIVIQLLRVGTVDGDGSTCNAGAGDRHHRGGPRLAPGLAREILFRAEAGEQYARGLDARKIGEQQRLARATWKVAARQQFF